MSPQNENEDPNNVHDVTSKRKGALELGPRKKAWVLPHLLEWTYRNTSFGKVSLGSPSTPWSPLWSYGACFLQLSSTFDEQCIAYDGVSWETWRIIYCGVCLISIIKQHVKLTYKQGATRAQGISATSRFCPWSRGAPLKFRRRAWYCRRTCEPSILYSVIWLWPNVIVEKRSCRRPGRWHQKLERHNLGLDHAQRWIT